jgi:hypothetical protein
MAVDEDFHLINPAITRMITINKNGIHSGDSTHSHDQVMTLHSLKIIKASNNNEVKPTPALSVFVLGMVTLLMLFLI